MENDFRKSQRLSEEDMKRYQRQEQARTAQQHRYTAKKGTRAKAKPRLTTRVGALALAAAIGIGGFSLANVLGKGSKEENATITHMQDENIDIQGLGLSENSIELFEKYDKLFENLESQNLSKADVLSAIDEIDGLHFSVVKEKIGSLIGESPRNIRMYYSFEKADGTYYTKVVANEGKYGEEVVYTPMSLIEKTIGKDENTIPREISDVIVQLPRLNALKANVEDDKLSAKNAAKDLREMYQNLEYVATSELVMDEKGNIGIIEYADNEKQQEEQRDERD